MNYQKAIAYLKNTIEFNNLEHGSVVQLSEVIKFLEQKERSDYTKTFFDDDDNDFDTFVRNGNNPKSY